MILLGKSNPIIQQCLPQSSYRNIAIGLLRSIKHMTMLEWRLIILLTIDRTSLVFWSGLFLPSQVQYSNTIVTEPDLGTFGNVSRYHVLLGSKFSIVTAFVRMTVVFRKPRDMTLQIISDRGNFTLDFKQRWFCASPLFLQTLEPWIPNQKQTLLSGKKTLDHWATLQCLFQENLGMRNVICLCVVTLDARMGFAWHSSQDCGYPCRNISHHDFSCHLIFDECAWIRQWPLWLTLTGESEVFPMVVEFTDPDWNTF